MLMDNNSNNRSKKNKLKKLIIAVIAVFAVLALLAYGLPLVLEQFGDEEDHSYNKWLFFEADYDKNILEDDWYLSHDRGIHYNRYGNNVVLTQENISSMPVSASFFYDYFDCIIRGDYENYPRFYTESCLSDENFHCPEKFTMQGLYDINVTLHSVSGDEESKITTEIYEVSYRIFENNGTYRDDILPDETRTRVFEIVINNGVAKINSITYRQFAN